MVQLQLPHDESKIYKKRRIYRTCNSYFMYVKCKDCGETTICFSHSQSTVRCGMCNSVLLKPTGGKARLIPGTGFKVIENQY